MNKHFILFFIHFYYLSAFCQINDSVPVPGRWSKEKINNWYAEQGWLVGCNYYPQTAINQIEMWQASTFNPETIEKELTWAQEIGMNTLRVYLHDLVHYKDEEGLYKRMDQFLEICAAKNIKPWFVFFDDCHYPVAQMGKQPLPIHSFHNSGWLNSPPRDIANRYAKGQASKAEAQRLKNYVQGTMRKFKDDDRILMWELYNEPGRGQPTYIGEGSNQLVYDSWVWARDINPSQPITSTTSGSVGERNIKINQTNADLFSIHNYSDSSNLRAHIIRNQKSGRPVIVSEWLARNIGSQVETCLPVMKELNAGAINWGFVSAKSGTVWPWTSRKDSLGNPLDPAALRAAGKVIKPGEEFPEPDVWFHDLFYIDGKSYDEKEIAVFKKLTLSN